MGRLYFGVWLTDPHLFEKPGYVSQDVLARSALRLREFEYRLEVRLELSGP